MKKCRNCRTNNSSNVNRCINCGSANFERKTTGIVFLIFAVFSLFNYITLVFSPWETQLEHAQGEPDTLIYAYIFQMGLVITSLLFSYRIWTSGYDWLFRKLGKVHRLIMIKTNLWQGRYQEIQTCYSKQN